MKNKTKSGFTLVELIVVIAILGILTVIALPKFQQYIMQAKLQKEISNARTVERAAIAFDAARPGEAVSPIFSVDGTNSFLTPYLDNNITMEIFWSDVDEPGEHAVLRTRKASDGDQPIVYYVFYDDPRMPDDGNLTALEDGIPVVWGFVNPEIGADGRYKPGYMPVVDYLKMIEDRE